ncbi:hypothetical protein GCM10007304_39530 [Rhodococcoides trifolii]|uniref:Polysaccharide biosynthesis protein C-terminal domain-containing protein n=1 Tax=Rhodococcoides trifolii TaxID=908250 RepID=A0A917G415_9NOCA|nr:polysaccharide biosynthesis C-terminal domain-containing protein [Rhodococcus trifolii]GGG21793.1 hypothetical protein GCM10007304_39530 [Rhodococcus trifolii]
MATRMKPLVRIGGFAAAVLGPAVAGFAVIPILVRVTSADEWASVAVGQSSGALATIAVALGWGFNGPTLAAVASPAERRTMAINSIIARGFVAPLAIGIACAVAALLRPDDAAVSAVSALAAALLGLGMTWLFIGAGDVRALLVLDAVPRVAASAVGVWWAASSNSALAFAWCQVVGAIVSILMSAYSSTRGERSGEVGVAIALTQAKKQVFASVTQLTSATYLTLPTLVVAALAPGSVFIYAIADRLSRLMFLVTVPVYQWLQGWVPSNPISQETLRRIKLATNMSRVIASTVALAIVIGGPTFAGFLGDSQHDLTWTLSVPIGLTIGFSVLSRCSGMVCLLALGKDRDVAVSAVLGAVCGIPLLFILVPFGGAVGAAVAVLISEAVVTAFQAYRLRSVVRTTRRNLSAEAQSVVHH